MEEVKQAESVAMCTGATNSGERVQASGNQHKMEYAVLNLISIKEELKDLLEEKQEKIKTIEKLDTDHYNILHKLYVQHLSMRECAKRAGIARDTANKMHKEAVGELGKLLDEMYGKMPK